jgi:hypothetical protein
MKLILDIDLSNNKKSFVEEFFKKISFVKSIKVVDKNEITNPSVLKSIEDYEQGKIHPTPLNLKELKEMINA